MKKQILEINIDGRTELTINVIEIHSLVFKKQNGYFPTILIVPFDIYCNFVCHLYDNRNLFTGVNTSSNFILISIGECHLKIIPVHNYKKIEFH